MKNWLTILFLLWVAATDAKAEEPPELVKSRAAFQNALLDVDIQIQKKTGSLQDKYIGALSRIESQLQSEGDLEGVLTIRKEKALIKDGTLPPEVDNQASKIRKIYRDSLQSLEDERNTERQKKVVIYRDHLNKQVVTGVFKTLDSVPAFFQGEFANQKRQTSLYRRSNPIKGLDLAIVKRPFAILGTEIFTRSVNGTISQASDSVGTKTPKLPMFCTPQVVTLTKAGRLAAAVLLRKELTGLKSIAETSLNATPASGQIERLIELPEKYPDPVEDPFEEGHWKKSLTVAPGKYRLKKSIHIGDHRSSTLVYLSKGSEYSLYEGKFHVWGGRLISEDCQFDKFLFRADHSGGAYFINCYLKECDIREEGPWYHYPNYDTVWYFENCNISKSFHRGNFNINYLGLCMTRCSVTRVELPGIWYNKSEPVARREDKWLTIQNCRFEKCKVPLSFLIATKNCAFVECRFEDDETKQEIKEKIDVTIYASNCSNAIKKAPPSVNLIEKRLSDLKVPVGSVLAEE